MLRPAGLTWRSSQTEGGGCLYDYACHVIDLINFLYASPAFVDGTILNKIFSKDVDDEVYTTFRFPGGATGQLAANWSDESFRKMSMQITLWGENGRIESIVKKSRFFLETQLRFQNLDWDGTQGIPPSLPNRSSITSEAKNIRCRSIISFNAS